MGPTTSIPFWAVRQSLENCVTSCSTGRASTSLFIINGSCAPVNSSVRPHGYVLVPPTGGGNGAGFEFPGAKGFRVHGIGLVQPSSFSGGFLRLVGPGTIALSYSELQLEVIPDEHVNRSCASLRGTRKSDKENIK